MEIFQALVTMYCGDIVNNKVMEANEIEDGKVLMIGDLVVGCIETDIVGEATYKIPCKVTEISHNGDVICEPLKSFPDELDWQEGDDFSWIEAIPLTAKILEKNGWKYNPIIKAYEWQDKAFYISIVLDEKTRIYVANDYIFGMALGAVHELQHALRLCGIDKEIVL